MVVDEELITKLRRLFDLNLYEVKIWTALLSRGVSTAGELSDIANIPRSRAYDVLESLEKKGFVVMKLGKPIKYISVPPTEVLERVKKYIKAESEKKIQRLDKLKGSDVLQELKLLHERGIDFIEPTELSGAIKGRTNIYNHLETMIKGAQKKILIASTENGVVKKLEALRPALEHAKKRGVSIKIMAPITEQNMKLVEKFKDIANIKNSENKEARFIVIDGKNVLFMTQHDNEVHPSYDVGIWVNSKFFGSALEHMFEHIWEHLPKK
ncbi:MAG: hypothetical protein OH319_03605 [Candidatus Parvarchaeota archaeon]|nr:hypothetical protein [Candidatus Jingweiarchaeum tengchongense]MCW1298566.1 hypothetical protein [Candidatus Jingweiarchaeum tengchongense]MCW1304589.1 hypothetical protein [Candidatus Jingweiarchaeum tengchongense]MCW1309174.1 hypothetical protein [Candidatus Jingweiarchaeum tengchongense]MCW1310261.1 hypothetical protein [Candidatus Jingweiarchaeum tengchongense]